jgi:hypothetical protein
MDADLRGFGFWVSATVLAHGSNFVANGVFRPLVVIRNSELMYLIRVYLRSSAVLCFWVLCGYFELSS